MPTRIRPSNSSRPKKAKRSLAPKRQAPPMRAPSVQHRLDEHARKWLALIKDPCHADLTVPCYSGTGEGYLIRTKDIISIPATSVDGVFEFTPGWFAEQLVRYGWSDTVGGSLGTCSNWYTSPFLRSQVVGRYRPVAACVRVYYSGTELERKGQIGLNLSPGRTLTVGETILGVASIPLTACGYSGRTPSDYVEVKWAPNEADSTWWAIGTSLSDEDTDKIAGTGNSMTVVYTNVPPGSLRLEYTAVYEWQPSEEVANGLVTTAKGPSSRNHINEILASLGDLSKFAYSKYAPKLAASLAQMLL